MKYALINGIILDGTKDMKPQSGKVILIDGEIIEDITDEVKDGYEIIDLKGQYVMPGLINLHVHLPSSGKPKKISKVYMKMANFILNHKVTLNIARKMCEGYALDDLKSGVTTIRTVGGGADIDTTIRNMINDGKIDGPRILSSNMAISVPGGHMAGSLAYAVNNKDEARVMVDKIAEDKPDLIKIMVTGGVLDARVKGEPGEVKMSDEIIKAVCDRAHELGLRVAAHTESPLGVKNALRNGVDTIEHGAKPDDEMIKLFKDHGSMLVATLSPAMPYALFDRSVMNTSEVEQYNGQIVFNGIVECAKECLKNDIPVGFGTDTGCPYTTHYNMWREVYYYHKYVGVSNDFALHTATLINARIAGIDKITGSIEKGKSCDLIVTKNNPLDSLVNLKDPTMVFMKGKSIIDLHINKMPEVDDMLDRYL